MAGSGWQIEDPVWLSERKKSWAQIERRLDIAERYTKKELKKFSNYYLKGEVPKWGVNDKDPIPAFFRLWFDPDQSLENWCSIWNSVLTHPDFLCVQSNLENTFDIFYSLANNAVHYSGLDSIPDGFMGGAEKRMTEFLLGDPADGNFIEYHGRKFDKRLYFSGNYYFDMNTWLRLKKIHNHFKANIYMLEYWYVALTDKYCEEKRDSIGEMVKPTSLELLHEYLSLVAFYPAPDEESEDFVRQDYCFRAREILDNRPLPELMQGWWQKAKQSSSPAKPKKK